MALRGGSGVGAAGPGTAGNDSPCRGCAQWSLTQQGKRDWVQFFGGAELHNYTGYVRALVQEKFLAATGWFVSFVARLLRARQVAYSRSV
jgi:hypothetical protein